MQIRLKRAAGAVRGAAAMGFADGDGEGVELVEEFGVAGDGISGTGFAGKRSEGFVTAAVFARSRLDEAMALGDAAQVLVGHGHRMAKRVEQDGVGGLRAYAGQFEQALA